MQINVITHLELYVKKLYRHDMTFDIRIRESSYLFNFKQYMYIFFTTSRSRFSGGTTYDDPLRDEGRQPVSVIQGSEPTGFYYYFK